jgi:hypothetical protein
MFTLKRETHRMYTVTAQGIPFEFNTLYDALRFIMRGVSKY